MKLMSRLVLVSIVALSVTAGCALAPVTEAPAQFFRDVIGRPPPSAVVILRVAEGYNTVKWMSFKASPNQLAHLLKYSSFKEDTFSEGGYSHRIQVFDIDSLDPPLWWRPTYVSKRYTIYSCTLDSVMDDWSWSRYLIVSPESDVIYAVYYTTPWWSTACKVVAKHE